MPAIHSEATNGKRAAMSVHLSPGAPLGTGRASVALAAGDGRYEPSASVVFHAMGEGEDGGLLLQDLERDIEVTLNQTGSQIWLSLCSGQPVAEIAGAIASAYDADPARVSRDVEETVAHLVQAGLVRRAAS